MSAHTPGPHRVDAIGRRSSFVAVAATVLSPDGERLADFRHVANANLFAAAPDLVSALRAAASVIRDGLGPSNPTTETAMIKVHAALAKAGAQ